MIHVFFMCAESNEQLEYDCMTEGYFLRILERKMVVVSGITYLIMGIYPRYNSLEEYDGQEIYVKKYDVSKDYAWEFIG